MNESDNSVSSKPGRKNVGKVWQPKQDASNFLLEEYERLQTVRSEIINHTSRRFEFYITFTSAALGALVLFSQGQNVVLSRSLPGLVVVGFITYGIASPGIIQHSLYV
jgi:hypothetical protein